MVPSVKYHPAKKNKGLPSWAGPFFMSAGLIHSRATKSGECRQKTNKCYKLQFVFDNVLLLWYGVTDRGEAGLQLFRALCDEKRPTECGRKASG